MCMDTKLFFESIGKLGLSEAQLEAIRRLHKACFESGDSLSPFKFNLDGVMNMPLYNYVKEVVADYDLPSCFRHLENRSKNGGEDTRLYKKFLNDCKRVIIDAVDDGVLPKEVVDGFTYGNGYAKYKLTEPGWEDIVVDILRKEQSLGDLKKKCKEFPNEALRDLYKRVYAFNRDDCIDMNVLFSLVGPTILYYSSDEPINVREAKIKNKIWHDGLLYDLEDIYGDLMSMYQPPEYDEVPIPEREYQLENLKYRLQNPDSGNIPRFRKVPKPNQISFNEFCHNPPKEVLDKILEDRKLEAKRFDNNEAMPMYIGQINKKREDFGIENQKPCFEGYERNLMLPMADNHNIHDAIQLPMATNSSHSNEVGAQQHPMTLSTNPNANRDPKKEMKECFPGKIVWKREKIKTDPKIQEMIKTAQGHIKQNYPVVNYNASAQPMACGFAAPNRMNYSPYKQGCAVGCYDGGGGADAGGPTV